MSDWTTLTEKTIRDDLDWVMINENSGGVSKKMRAYNYLAGLGGGLLPYVLLRDKKVTGTNGGSFMSGARRVRDLNEVVVDTDDICILASNQFTLPAGTYRISVGCPAYYVGRHQTYLRNVSDGVDEAIGSSEFVYYGVHEVSRSFLSMRFTISASKTFEIQHECEDDAIGYGFGVAAGFGPYEVYTVVEIWKEE